MEHENKSLRLAATLLSMSPLLALAAPPDAGQLMNEMQRVQTSPVRPGSEPKTDASERDTADGQGLSALIQRIRFSGGEGLASEAELQSWVADRLGRRLNHVQLQSLADRVSARLQAKGFMLARAFLPRQDLSSGELEIAIVAGRLQDGPARVSLSGGNPALQARLQAIAAANLPDGPTRAEDLERALLLMRDVPGVSVRSALEKGDQPGTSRLQGQVQELPAWGASASLDNFANRYTGAAHATARGVLNRPLEREDQAVLSLSKTRDTSQAALAYTWALSPKGLRANVNGSTMRYRVGEELAALDLRGTARSLGAGLSFPLQRGRERNVWLTLDAEQRRLDDQALGVSLHQRRVERVSAGFNANAWDDWFGGGQTNWGVNAAGGSVGLARNPDDAAADAAGAATQGGFSKLSWQFVRQQSLAGLSGWSVFVSANGQLASKNLDSSEKFMLGGPAAVRAYAVGEATGDSGWLASMELRREFRVWDVLAQGLGFVDAGWIAQHQRPWKGALADPATNRYRLAGAGLGFNLAGERWSLRSAWSHAIGSNPGRSSNGLEADGRAERKRAWVQLNLAY